VAATDAEAQRNARDGMGALLAARISVRPRSYDDLYRERLVMVGDPQHCIDHIAEIQATGTNYIIFMMNFATLEQKKILAAMEIMAKEVIPKFASSRR
jgi:alkanesulfonate monooxygenase SsuD/methylene tetrahydromethanopterin reductase-like flavin-dependent oxidoreductase (luciferase family)